MDTEVKHILNLTLDIPARILDLLYLSKSPDYINIKIDMDMFLNYKPKYKLYTQANIKRYNILKQIKYLNISKLDKEEQYFYETFKYDLLNDHIPYVVFLMMLQNICLNILKAKYTLNIYEHNAFPYQKVPSNNIMVLDTDTFNKKFHHYIDNGVSAFVTNPTQTGCYYTRQTYPDNSLITTIRLNHISDIDHINLVRVNKHADVNKSKTKVIPGKLINYYINIHLNHRLNRETYKSIMLWLLKQYKSQEVLKSNTIITISHEFFEKKHTPLIRNQYSEYMYLLDYHKIPIMLEIDDFSMKERDLKYYNNYNGIIIKDVSQVI